MALDAVEIRPVSGRAAERAFLALPYRLYRDDPNWVAPLHREERRRWSVRHNPSLATRATARFLACRGERVVGRIAAVVDPAFTARWDAGFFGFFECEPDEAAAAALFSAAEQFLAGQQLDHVVGPVSLTTHDEVGFLVDGHGVPPMVLSPYNPPYYPALAEVAGYDPCRDYDAYLWTARTRPAAVVDRLLRRVAVAGERAVHIRHLDPAHWDAELRAIFVLYNHAFAGLWGFVPITWDEFEARAHAFRAFYRPELVIIAELAGNAVGFGLVLPDVNAALRPLRGRLFPFGLPRLMRALPRLDTGRFILLGVHPGHTGRGVAALIAYAMAETAHNLGITRVELSLVQGGNERMRHVIEAFSAPRIKTYRLYGKAL